ncbi:hypothetical protein GWK47_016924 [Chionoecetes opilio]|uniref:Uncharacterized protein n=1 Tax=Chionoecetes opilio TaxID=41210 RepID=A0A8J4XU33_CHIOP|nr:hypothetical protein GWK47_016924 [Chionoecetes opilio]
MSWQDFTLMGIKQEEEEEEEEEVTTKVTQLEREVEELRSQLSLNNPFHVPIPTPHLPMNNVKEGLTKPRDIPILELYQLQGLDAAYKCSFELVEQCSSSDATRIQIAKGRVSPEFAISIHNNQTNQKIESWPALRNLFQTEFATEVSIDRAWQELESMCYDWGESPQAFTHRFICQHAVIETRFPNERFPNRDKTIKRKLWYGLPPESRERQEGFLDEGYPLKKFIDRLEHERQLLEERHIPRVNMIPERKKK